MDIEMLESFEVSDWNMSMDIEMLESFEVSDWAKNHRHTICFEGN